MADKTNDELKAELDKLGMEYAQDAKKDELKALLAEAKKPLDPEPAAASEETSDTTEDAAEAAPTPEPKEDASKAETVPLAASTDTVRVKLTNPEAKSLNVRVEPAGDVIQTVPNGAELEVVGDQKDGWIPVKITGYVMASLVESTDE